MIESLNKNNIAKHVELSVEGLRTGVRFPPAPPISSFRTLTNIFEVLYFMNINLCRIITLPKIQDSRGNLTSIESSHTIPFEIKRIYYIYDIPGGSERGSHAHGELEQLLVAVSGSFDVVINDGITNKRIHLNRPDFGLYICPMIWRNLENFSSGSVCLSIASLPYDEKDYYRIQKIQIKFFLKKYIYIRM